LAIVRTNFVEECGERYGIQMGKNTAFGLILIHQNGKDAKKGLYRLVKSRALL